MGVLQKNRPITIKNQTTIMINFMDQIITKKLIPLMGLIMVLMMIIKNLIKIMVNIMVMTDMKSPMMDMIHMEGITTIMEMAMESIQRQ